MDWNEVRRRIGGTSPKASDGQEAGAPQSRSPRVAVHHLPVLTEPLLSALRTAAAHRSVEDNQRLADLLAGLRLPLLEELCETGVARAELLQNLAPLLTYSEHTQEGEVLFRRGDQADRMYIVVGGGVSVWVPRTASAEYPSPAQVARERLRTSGGGRSSFTPSQEVVNLRRRSGRPTSLPRGQVRVVRAGAAEAADEEDDGELRLPRAAPLAPEERAGMIVPVGITDVAHRDDDQLVGFLRAGGPNCWFGELGLLSDGLTRSATVRVGAGGANLLELDRASFDSVLRGRLEAVVASKMESMRRFSIFEGLSDSHLRMLALQTHQRSYEPGQFLVRRGQCGESIICLVNGQAEQVVEAGVGGEAASEGSSSPECAGGSSRGSMVRVSNRGSLQYRPQVEYTRLGLVLPGGTIGSVADSGPVACGVRAVRPCSTLEINREAYESRVRRDPVVRS